MEKGAVAVGLRETAQIKISGVEYTLTELTSRNDAELNHEAERRVLARWEKEWEDDLDVRVRVARKYGLNEEGIKEIIRDTKRAKPDTLVDDVRNERRTQWGLSYWLYLALRPCYPDITPEQAEDILKVANVIEVGKAIRQLTPIPEELLGNMERGEEEGPEEVKKPRTRPPSGKASR